MKQIVNTTKRLLLSKDDNLEMGSLLKLPDDSIAITMEDYTPGTKELIVPGIKVLWNQQITRLKLWSSIYGSFYDLWNDNVPMPVATIPIQDEEELEAGMELDKKVFQRRNLEHLCKMKKQNLMDYANWLLSNQ